MKSRDMLCPLTGGVIDSDLCYDVQECIEGNIPVTIELEDFLEKGNCAKICHECENNYLSDHDNSHYGYSSLNSEERKELAIIIRKLDNYRAWFNKILEKEQETYDSLNDIKQNSEKGKRLDRLTNALFLGANYLEDIVSVFNDYIEDTDVSEDNPITETKTSDHSVADQTPVGIDRDSYEEWAETLKSRIEIMTASFRFCGLEKPRITCYVQELEELGTTLDFYIEVSGTDGNPVRDGFVLKLNLYTDDDRLVGAKETDITADMFGGYDTFLFRFPDCKKLNILSYGKLYASRL